MISNRKDKRKRKFSDSQTALILSNLSETCAWLGSDPEWSDLVGKRIRCEESDLLRWIKDRRRVGFPLESKPSIPKLIKNQTAINFDKLGSDFIEKTKRKKETAAVVNVGSDESTIYNSLVRMLQVYIKDKGEKDKFVKHADFHEALIESGIYQYVRQQIIQQFLQPDQQQGFNGIYHSVLPFECKIIYYQADKEFELKEHLDKVSFCTVILSLTNDDNETSLQIRESNGIYRAISLQRGEMIIFGRVHHRVIIKKRKDFRCVIAFFY
jgi:hypothetical protein